MKEEDIYKLKTELERERRLINFKKVIESIEARNKLTLSIGFQNFIRYNGDECQFDSRSMKEEFNKSELKNLLTILKKEGLC